MPVTHSFRSRYEFDGSIKSIKKRKRQIRPIRRASTRKTSVVHQPKFYLTGYTRVIRVPYTAVVVVSAREKVNGVNGVPLRNAESRRPYTFAVRSIASAAKLVRPRRLRMIGSRRAVRKRRDDTPPPTLLTRLSGRRVAIAEGKTTHRGTRCAWIPVDFSGTRLPRGYRFRQLDGFVHVKRRPRLRPRAFSPFRFDVV